MRTYDLSPLFRSTIGFDRLGRLLESSLSTETVAYPPYNIEKLGDNAYRITMAVAGFGADDIDLTVQDNSLTIRGKAGEELEGVQYLHRGIAGRAFERQFQLADHVEVQGAKLENGLLHHRTGAAHSREHEAPQDRDRRDPQICNDRAEEGGLISHP